MPVEVNPNAVKYNVQLNGGKNGGRKVIQKDHVIDKGKSEDDPNAGRLKEISKKDVSDKYKQGDISVVNGLAGDEIELSKMLLANNPLNKPVKDVPPTFHTFRGDVGDRFVSDFLKSKQFKLNPGNNLYETMIDNNNIQLDENLYNSILNDERVKELQAQGEPHA